jgi:amidohydrolase
MDALPILEQSGKEYASLNPGVMHACGHDGHTTILMGVARLLSEMKDEIAGNVKFLFQPAEEGPGGALPMIEAGVLDNPKVDAAIGLHLEATRYHAGQIGLKAGASSAAPDSMEIRITGRGGHGAHPHRSVDAIVAAGHLIVALQSIVSREIDPLGSVVVTVGTIHGGYRSNVIADEVVMTGTVRTLDPQVRAAMPTRIERIVKGICEGLRCSYSIGYHEGPPSVVNDASMTDLVEDVAHRILGQDNVFRVANPSMGGEDFSYFAERVPSQFFNLGGCNPAKGCDYPGHHPKYDFDEDAIPYGMAVLAGSALEFLNRK